MNVVWVQNLFVESVRDNPVLVKEFRTRMRGWKAFGAMGAYALFTGLVLFITYVVLWNEYAGPSSGQFGASIVNRDIGQKLFVGLVWAQAVLISLFVPSLAFGAITQEIEKKTIEMLALTRLTPGKIVLGKQLSGFLYALILLLSSIPLASLCLVFGGISPTEIAVSYAILAAWAFLLAAMGVFWSSLFNRTAAAALFGYGAALGYFLSTVVIGTYTAAAAWGMPTRPQILGALNPGWAPYNALLTAEVCGIKMPLALPAIVLHLAIGALLLLVASTHVKHCRANRAMPIRVLLLAITGLLTWLIVGNLGSLGVTAILPSYALAVIVVLILVLTGLGASVFATGEVKLRGGHSFLSYAMSPLLAFKNDLGGGISFVALWAALLYAVLGGSFWWVARIQHAPHMHAFWTAYRHIGVAVLAMVIGVSAVGVLGSVLTKQRRVAAALVILFLIGAFGGYGVCLAYYQPGMSTDAPVWQLAAFWPMTPIFGSTGDWSRDHLPKLRWLESDSWLVTTAAYIMVALVALCIASAVKPRYEGVKEE